MLVLGRVIKATTNQLAKYFGYKIPFFFKYTLYFFTNKNPPRGEVPIHNPFFGIRGLQEPLMRPTRQNINRIGSILDEGVYLPK